MSRHIFLRIMNAVEAHDDYFVQKRNAANILGLSCFQKVTAAFRMITYGVPAKVLYLSHYVGLLLQLLIFLKVNT